MDPLTITRLGHLGDGLTVDGHAVPYTLPGERVAPDPPHSRLSDSALRREPRCAQFGLCGGCALQHAEDGFLASWKTDVVVQALSAHGLAAPFDPPFTAPEASRRRAVLAARRTKKGVEIGFHMRRSDRVVPIPDCAVLRPELTCLAPRLAEIVRLGASRKGAVRMALTWTEAGADLDVTGAKPLDLALRTALAALAGQLDLARLSWAGEVVAVARAPLLRMGSARVTPPPGAFLQASAEAEGAMAEAVSAALGPAGQVVDLFAGCGTFALRLARRAEVQAVEGDGAMLDALEAAWRGADGLRRVGVERRDLFRRPLAPAELARFDGAVIDPPRAGAEAQIAALAASAVPRIAAVSCNPVTFARDAAKLVAGGYALDRVRVFDQFRWSPHVELVAAFRREGSS